MRYLQNLSILLAILLVAGTFIIPTQSSEKPPFPDFAIVTSAEKWMKKWEEENVVPAKQDVDNAYDDLSGLASAYKDAINSVGDVAYSSVSGAVQESWVGLLMSLYDKTKSAATSMAKTHSLQTAVEAGISNHSMELYYFDDLWNSHGRVMQDIVWTDMNTQRNDGTGTFTLSANTMMEAYYKVTYVADLYNKQVAKWNEYAYRYEPNQTRSTYHPSSPTYPTFDKFRCFGGCNYEHDTLDYARDTHKDKCGTADNVDEVVRKRRGNIYDVKRELRRRSVAQGCGRDYYVCNLDDREAHLEKTCPTSGCSVKYRNCLSHTKPHSSHVSSAQAPSSASLSPSGGSYTASAGDTHTANVSVPSGYQYVYWYIAGPGIDGLGLLQETDSGYGTSTTASFSWSIPSYASGDHVITAYTQLPDNSIVQPSYTVTVGSSSSTDTTDTTTTDTSSTTDDDSSTSSTSPYSLSASSTGSTLYSGDTLTLTLSGYESIYSVDWYLEESPQWSGSISISSDYKGESGQYDSSVSYTFSSGYTGDFVFKAVVYTHGNMTRYEHTYTVNVPY